MFKISSTKINEMNKNILRLGVYQIQFMHSVPNYAAVNSMVEIAKKDAENVKARIVEEGRIEIKRMKEQASFVLKQEQRKAEDDLRRWIAEESVKLASVNLKKKMNSNFEDKLVKDFVDQINQNKGIL